MQQYLLVTWNILECKVPLLKGLSIYIDFIYIDFIYIDFIYIDFIYIDFIYIDFISRGNVNNGKANLPYDPQTITIATKHIIKS